jgi:CubicO group peptidase (beta-lactamase class C family)
VSVPARRECSRYENEHAVSEVDQSLHDVWWVRQALTIFAALMKRFRIQILLLAVAVGLAVWIANAAAGHSPRDIPSGTGYSALDLCTRTLHSREPLEQVRTRYVEPKVNPLALIWSVDYAAGEHVRVQTILPWLSHPRSAIYRAGLGCTVIPPGASEAAVRAQALEQASETRADARPWPMGEGPAEDALLAAPARAVLEQHAPRIFDDSSELKTATNTTALLVAYDGHLVYERYGQNHQREQPQIGWSMTKTLTALMAGVLSREGKLELDAPVGLSRWKGTRKAEITWRHLLNMAPGLAWFEGYGGASDATQMLFSQADQGAWAADRPLTHKPGTHFVYSTGFTNIAMLGMRELLGGKTQALYDLYQQRLFAPLGIRGGVIELDASGTPVGGARGVLRPVDWLRLGRLVESRGSWNGQEILSPAWVDFMTRASPASAEYGGFMWRRETPMIAPELRKALPADLSWFAGHMGQFVIVMPSKKLVVLRMGVAMNDTMETSVARDRVFELVRDLVAVY